MTDTKLKHIKNDCCRICVYLHNKVDCPNHKKLNSYGYLFVEEFILDSHNCSKFEKDHTNAD